MSSAPERTGQGYTTYQETGYPAAPPPTRYAEPQLGLGAWLGRALAGVLMIFSGVLSFATGLAGVTHGGFFLHVSATYPYHWTVHNWGWSELILGLVVVAAGICVFFGFLWARIVGVILAVLSGVASFLFIPFYPFWSIVAIGVDVFVIWALMTTGRRRGI